MIPALMFVTTVDLQVQMINTCSQKTTRLQFFLFSLKIYQAIKTKLVLINKTLENVVIVTFTTSTQLSFDMQHI